MLAVKIKKLSFFAIVIVLVLGAVWPALALSDVQLLPINRDLRDNNTRREAELIEKYGGAEFYRCFACVPDKLDNPFAVSACLAEAEHCLSGADIRALNCPAGQTASAGRCVSLRDGCRERFGENSYYLGFEEDGKYACGCQDGYIWNNDKSRCIQAACPDDYLYYSSYRGTDGGFLHGRCVTRDEA